MEEAERRTLNAERRSLNSVLAILDSTKSDIEKQRKQVDDLDLLIKEIDKEIQLIRDNKDRNLEDVDIMIELAKKKQELQINRMNLVKVSLNLAPTIEKNIDVALRLRQKVMETSFYEESNKDALPNFIVDILISKY